MDRSRAVWRGTIEVAAALAIASLAVTALKGVAHVTGLGVIYLLAVLAIAIRWGQWAALLAAVLSVLILNFFFLPPVHRLTIADSRNVVSLVVFLVTAAVVGRLAGMGRERTREADTRAREARARGREAALLGTTASSLLLDASEWAPPDVPNAGARIALASAPSHTAGELAVRLPTREESCWLYVRRDQWDKEDA